jgi:apolipoprotein D and lipocalin family protein
MKMFAAQGYDTSRFLKVPQYPEQLDQPGFQTPEK